MKEVKVILPEGYEIDKENSTLECIKFKKISKQKFDYIDLGLPSGTLWATCNVGVDNCDYEGDYFTYYEAIKKFGNNLPKEWQWKELIEECNWKWINELKGYRVTGLNGKSIFLPAAGFHSEGRIYGIGASGFYWSSLLDPYDNNSAYTTHFNSYQIDWHYYDCYDEHSVRLCKFKN